MKTRGMDKEIINLLGKRILDILEEKHGVKGADNGDVEIDTADILFEISTFMLNASAVLNDALLPTKERKLTDDEIRELTVRSMASVIESAKEIYNIGDD